MNHFHEIGAIAAFIGARLQYPCPLINGQGNPWTSTIKVDQHKDKFGHVRVYCTLGDPALVQQRWDWLKLNRGGHRFKLKDVAPDNVDGTVFNEEFHRRCVKHDAIWYRRVYRDAVALRPDLEEKIILHADYAELLFATYEEFVTYQSQFDHVKAKFQLASHSELLEYMASVYDPKLKDLMELRD